MKIIEHKGKKYVFHTCLPNEHPCLMCDMYKGIDDDGLCQEIGCLGLEHTSLKLVSEGKKKKIKK